jgi:hypothetical protein
VSEKTVELNVCAQVPALAGQRLLWFGVTQKQERKLGFDAAVRLNGRVLLFQFKASNWTLSGGERRFQVSHDQLRALRRQLKAHRRTVFYAFPMIGETAEIGANAGDFLSTTWLVDVADLDTLREPTRRDGRPRLTKRHYVDLRPPRAVFHSEPTDVEVLNARSFFEEGMPGADGLAVTHEPSARETRPDLAALARAMRRHAVGLVVCQ